MEDELFSKSIYTTPQSDKVKWLVEQLNLLVDHHRAGSLLYDNFMNANGLPRNWKASSLHEFPPLAVRLFKQLDLKSIPDDEVFKTLFSSGTSGEPSRIYLDRETAKSQSKALVKIMQQWLGRQRLPMLVVDHPGVIRDRLAFSARGAGIQGFSFLGRDHTYALKDDMEPDWEGIETFCGRHAHQPVLLFGFTFMVWSFLVKKAKRRDSRFHLPEAILLHGGGWKKMIEDAVSPETFKAEVQDVLGITRVHDYYGMVEQVGSIFVECEAGHLHAPVFADVIIRSPGNWQPLSVGKTGVIEVLSILPKSYPGHVLLTEDMGMLLGEDDCRCGRKGRYFLVSGRLPRAEARGCSDTFEHGGQV